MKKHVLSLCVGLALTLPAMHSVAKPEREMRDVLAQLSLSKEQRETLRTSMKASYQQQDRAQLKESMAKQKQLRKTLQQLIMAEQFDQAAVQAVLAELAQLRADHMFRKAQQRATLLSVLDDQQEDALTAIMQLKQRGVQQSEEAKPQRWMKRLGLSDEQQSQLQALNASQQSARSQAMQTHKAFKDAEKALIDSGNLTRESWQALLEQYQDDFQVVALDKAKHRHAVMQVLSAEQKQKALMFQDMREKRAKEKFKQKREKHREHRERG